MKKGHPSALSKALGVLFFLRFSSQET